MESISRFHEITRGFLQQACLDIERNGLDVSIQMPVLHKYREVWKSKDSSIPLIARSSVAKHSDILPVLPGRLPLSNPKGAPRPSNLRIEKGHGFEVPTSLDKMMGELLSRECFKAVLGAVTRNVTPPQSDASSHKRKRVSPSPAPETINPFGHPGAPTTSSPQKGNERANTFAEPTPSGNAVSKKVNGTYPWQSLGVLAQGQISLSLPDRTTSSSASSPANQGFGTGTDTMSGSSHTSPGIGLGNTLEENRIDLRAFQNRIQAPVWQTTEETFFAQMTETIMNNPLPTDGTDPWGILDAEIDWSQAPGAS